MSLSLIVLLSSLCSCSSKTNNNSDNSSSADSSSSSIAIIETDNTLLPKAEEQVIDYTTVDTQYSEKADELKASFEKISSEKDMPVINITTQDSQTILSKEEYVPSVIDVFNCDEKYVLSADGGVKVRGNSTAEQGDEKPYRIKFSEKHNMLGLHDGNEYKSWVLLRSYWNLAPDYTAFNLAKVIFDGKYYSSDCTYVNLYINGQSRGLYLLCEQNQVADDRVDVYEPKEDEYQTDIGYLIEMDNYAGDEHPYFTLDYNNAEFTDITGETRTICSDDYSVKSDINTQGQLDFIHKYTAGVFDIVFEAVQNNKAMKFDDAYNVVEADCTAKEAVEAVLDLESVSDMLILEELVHNMDVGAGSFYMAVDFSEESKYPKLTFLAPWDFNWAYEGSSSGQYYAGAFQEITMNEDRSNAWFTVLMKSDWFQQIVKDKWNAMEENMTLQNCTSKISENLSLLEKDLGENSWSINMGKGIVDFVNGRIEWLNTKWK